MNLVTIEEVEQYTCDAYATFIDEVKKRGKVKEDTEARRMIMYLLFRFTKMQSGEISSHYGCIPNTSVKDFDRIRCFIGRDREIRRTVEGFEKIYNNSPKIR